MLPRSVRRAGHPGLALVLAAWAAVVPATPPGSAVASAGSAGSAMPVAVAAGSAPVRALPAATYGHLSATFTGKRRGLVLVSNLPGGLRARFVLDGLAPGKRYRLVAQGGLCPPALASAQSSSAVAATSPRPAASVRPAGTAVVLGAPFRANADGEAAGTRTVPGGTGVDALVSVRLVRVTNGPATAGCANGSRYPDAGSPAVAAIGPAAPVVVTGWFRRASTGISALVLTEPIGGDTWRSRAAVIALGGGDGATHRLVGSKAPCGAVHTAAHTLFQRSLKPAWVRASIQVPAVEPGNLLQSVRFFRGSGTAHPAGCLQLVATMEPL